MNQFLSSQTIVILILTACWLAAQAQTNFSDSETSSNTASGVSGLKAGISLFDHHRESKEVHYISLNVLGVQADNSNQPTVKTNSQIDTRSAHHKAVLMFRPTNSFCGLIELKDQDGNVVQPINASINDLHQYPKTYSVKTVSQKLMLEMSEKPQGASGALIYSGPSLPLGITPPNYEFSTFYLGDYFSITNAGLYQLTIWPKIYKRTLTNEDICERIDLPVLTIPIKCSGHEWASH